jgi:hypothetical protein
MHDQEHPNGDDPSQRLESSQKKMMTLKETGVVAHLGAPVGKSSGTNHRIGATAPIDPQIPISCT